MRAARPVTCSQGIGMKARTGWLDRFVKWFFNASPLWVDEREAEESRTPPQRDRRAANGERRRNPESRQVNLSAQQRRRGS